MLWGTSWSGGHIVYVAADDGRIAAVISQTPDLDGVRTLLEIARYGGVGQLARLTAHGIRDAADALRGREPHMIPIAARPGTVAAMSSEEAEPGYTAIGGPTWRNEITARAVLDEGRNRAITRIGELNCPILIQIAEHDSIAPPPRPRRRPGAPRAARRCASTPAPTSTSTSASGASARSRTSSTSCAGTWPRAGSPLPQPRALERGAAAP